MIQKNRLKYLLKTFLQRFFLNILTCFFVIKKLTPSKRILATAFIISSYLLISGCSDSNCVEADDFGEYVTATVVVPSSSNSTYCKFDENYSLDPFNSLANHGERMKKCLTSQERTVVVGVELKNSGPMGCSGFAEEAYKQACILDCKQSCGSITSGETDLTKPSAEPGWTYTELPTSFGGISITPESQIYITATGSVALTKDLEEKSYYVVPNKNNFHSANLAGQFSASDSSLLLKSNQAVTLFVSGKFTANISDTNIKKTYGTIYNKNNSSSPVYDLSQRLIAYLEPTNKPSTEEIKTYSKLNKPSNLGKYGGKLYYKQDYLYTGITDRNYEEDYLKDALTKNSSNNDVVNLSKLNYCFNGNFDTASDKIIDPDFQNINYDAISKERLSCVVAIPSPKIVASSYSFIIPDFTTDFSSFHIYATKYKNISGLSDIESVAKFSYYHKFNSDAGNFLPFKELKNQEIVRDNVVNKLTALSVAEKGDKIIIERSDPYYTAPVFIVISAAKHEFVNRIKLNQSGLSSIYNIKGTASSCNLYSRVINDIADADTSDKDDTDAESKIVEQGYVMRSNLPTDTNSTNKEFFVRKGQYLLLDWGDVANRASCVDVPLLINRYRPAAFCKSEILQTITNPFCTTFKEGADSTTFTNIETIPVDGNVIGCTAPSFDDCSTSTAEDYCSGQCLGSCSSNSANNNYCLECIKGTSTTSEITKRSCSILDGTWKSSGSSACIPHISSHDKCYKCLSKLKSYSEMPYQINGSVDYCYNIDNYKKTFDSFLAETLDERKKYLVGSITSGEAGNLGNLSFSDGSAFNDNPATFKASAVISPNQESYLKFLIIGDNFIYGEDNFLGTSTTFHKNITPTTDYLKMSINVSSGTQNGDFLEARLCGDLECSDSSKYLHPKIISIEAISQNNQHLTCPPGYTFDTASTKCRCATGCNTCGTNETFNSITNKCECNSSSLSWAKKNGVTACYPYGAVCQVSTWDIDILDEDKILRNNLIKVDGSCTCPDGWSRDELLDILHDGQCYVRDWGWYGWVYWYEDTIYSRVSNTNISPITKPDIEPTVTTKTSSSYDVSPDSNYYFDDSGVLTRITEVNSSSDCSVIKTVVKGGDVYCHKNFYYDDTADSAETTTKKAKIAKLQLAFRIYDPEVKNCKLFSTSTQEDGVKAINPKSTSPQSSATVCDYDTYQKGTCTSGYYCDSAYANNTGFYNVRIKIKDPKTTSSNFIDSIIRTTDEITRGKFKVDNGEYTRTSPPLFESLYINVIADSTYQGILRMCLILFIAFFGTGYFLGTVKFTFQELAMMVFRLSFVMLMVTPGGYTYFNTLFVVPFQQATDYLTFNFAAAFNDSPQIALAIERKDFFDRSILFNSSDDVLNIMISAATRKKVSALLFAGAFGWVYLLLILTAFFKYIFAIGTTLLIYLTAQIIISFLFLFAPVIFVMLFFKQTRESFGAWLGSLFSLSLQQIFVIMTISFFNAVVYDLIKMVLGYRVCWDDVWSKNIGIIRITLLSFWTFSGLAPRDGSNLEPVTEGVDGFPSIFSVFSIYFVAYLAKEFVDIASSIAESIGGSFWGGGSGGNVSAAGISKSLRSEISGGIDKFKDGMSKIGGFAANRLGNKVLESVGYKSEGEINKLNAQQDKDIGTSKQMKEAGDSAVSDYKVNNANELADMTAKEKRDTLEQVRNDGIKNFAKENDIDNKELERLRNFKPEYHGQDGLLHMGGAKLFSAIKGDNVSINERKIEKTSLTRSEAKKAMDNMDSGERKKFLENVKGGKIRVDTGPLDIRRNANILADKSLKSLQQNLDPKGKLIDNLDKGTIDRNKARADVIKDLVEKGEIPDKKWFEEYSAEDAEKIDKKLEENAPDSYFDNDNLNSADTYQELKNYEKFEKEEDEKSEAFQKEDADASYKDTQELGEGFVGKMTADFRQFKRDFGNDFKKFVRDTKHNMPNFSGVGNEKSDKFDKKNKQEFRDLLKKEREDALFDRPNANDLDPADVTRAEMRELIVNFVSSENVAEDKF